jgi:hypothetical protein
MEDWTFVCASCGEDCVTDHPKEEMVKDYKKVFLEEPDEKECAMVCDECYEKLMNELKKQN